MGDNSPQARAVDLTVFDQLGPLTRKVIQDSPLEIKVGQMLAQAPADLTNDDGWGWNDKRLAEWLARMVRSRTGKPLTYFQLQPRRTLRR